MLFLFVRRECPQNWAKTKGVTMTKIILAFIICVGVLIFACWGIAVGLSLAWDGVNDAADWGKRKTGEDPDWVNRCIKAKSRQPMGKCLDN